jgi:hypothetical protein
VDLVALFSAIASIFGGGGVYAGYESGAKNRQILTDLENLAHPGVAGMGSLLLVTSHWGRVARIRSTSLVLARSCRRAAPDWCP